MLRYPAKKFGFPGLASKDIPNFLAPTPSRGSPPPHPKISGPKRMGLGSFFFPDLRLNPEPNLHVCNHSCPWCVSCTLTHLYLQLRSFCLRFVFFTYGGNRKQRRPNPISRRGRPQAKKTRLNFNSKSRRPNQIYRKQPRPTVRNKDLTASKKDYPFQSVIFQWGISRAPGSSPGTSLCTRTRMKLVHRSHTQQNKGTTSVKFLRSHSEQPPGGDRIPFLLCKGSSPGTQHKK